MVSSRRRSWLNASSVALTTLAWLPDAERFGQHVLDARRFDDRTHAAAGDDAGAGRRRTQQHATTAVFADHLVRNRVLVDGHTLTIALRADSEALRIASATSLALPKPQPTLPSWSPATIKRAEGKPAATFDDLGASVDEHDLLGRFATDGALLWLVSRWRSPPRRFPPDCWPGGIRKDRSCYGLKMKVKGKLKVEATSARRVGQRLDLAVVLRAAAVEHDAGDALGLGAFGDERADFFRRGDVGAGGLVVAEGRFRSC